MAINEYSQDNAAIWANIDNYLKSQKRSWTWLSDEIQINRTGLLQTKSNQASNFRISLLLKFCKALNQNAENLIIPQQMYNPFFYRLPAGLKDKTEDTSISNIVDILLFLSIPRRKAALAQALSYFEIDLDDANEERRS